MLNSDENLSRSRRTRYLAVMKDYAYQRELDV